MQVLSDLIPITNGEVFDIIRRNRDQRNVKSLPHFHAQSASSTTGSSAHQHLVMTSRFAHRNENQQDKPKETLVIVQPSLLTTNQVHNTVPHSEIKVLHYLQKERNFYGPSSVVLRRFHQMVDYRASDDEEDVDEKKGNTFSTAVAVKREESDNVANSGASDTNAKIRAILNNATIQGPTPLATQAKEYNLKVEQGLIDPSKTAPPSTPPPQSSAAVGSSSSLVTIESCTPTLFAFDSTRENVVRLEQGLSSLREAGHKQTKALITALRNRCFVGAALVSIMQKAWKDQTAADKNSYESAIGPVNKTLLERGLAKCLAGSVGGSLPNINSILSLVTSNHDFKNTNVVNNILSTNGVALAPTVLRNIVDLRHSLFSAAHVAAVIPAEMDWVGSAAEFVLRAEAAQMTENKPAGNVPMSLLEGFRYSTAEHLCRTVVEVLAEFL
eukprot:GILI01023279.1.p1 GENE.GILI01023279.1~~GILI01023279.1.p1  ORF type:complete len:460 (-),score=75.61 GILI01023279.1:42-1367(-)